MSVKFLKTITPSTIALLSKTFFKANNHVFYYPELCQSVITNYHMVALNLDSSNITANTIVFKASSPIFFS